MINDRNSYRDKFCVAKIENLEPSKYHVRLKLNGFVDHRKIYNIQPGGFNNIHIKLSKIKGEKKSIIKRYFIE